MDTTTATSAGSIDEQVLAIAEGIYRWDGPKRKATLLSGKLGRLVLTNERLLFLSSGRHDVTVGKVLAGASGSHFRSLRTDRTDDLDIAALANDGSLDLPLAWLRAVELKGMFKFLSITFEGVDGVASASAFAPKNGGMPDGRSWIESIDQARSAASRS